MNEHLTELERVAFEELDYAIGELQRTAILIGVIRSRFGRKEQEIFDRAIECIRNRERTSKVAMARAGYVTVVQRENLPGNN